MKPQPTTLFDNTVQSFSLTNALTRFRQQIESEAGEPVGSIEVNAALLLSDLCQFLGLGAEHYCKILGPQGSHYLQDVLQTTVRRKIQH